MSRDVAQPSQLSLETQFARVAVRRFRPSLGLSWARKKDSHCVFLDRSPRCRPGVVSRVVGVLEALPKILAPGPQDAMFGT